MKKLFFIILVFLTVLNVSQAQTTPAARQKSFNIASGNLALQGYDPVAYFTTKKPTKGNSRISYSHEGVTYYFASEANKKAFTTSPTAYEPQYGGWCAYAMGATGEKVEIDPTTFKILNGKLYLFYNAYFNNTLPKWNSDEKNLKAKAETNWAKFTR